MNFIYHKCEECGEPSHDLYCYGCILKRNERLKRAYLEPAYSAGTFSAIFPGFQTSISRTYNSMVNKESLKQQLKGFNKRELFELFADLIG